MDCYDRIKTLCARESISVRSLQTLLNLKRGSVRGLSKSPGKLEILIKIATHFDVSTDYLLGLTNNIKPIENIETISPEMKQLIQDLVKSHFSNEQVITIQQYISDSLNFPGGDQSVL